MIILSPYTTFLLLSPGPSFFPCPTFQNQTTNLIPSRLYLYDAVILDVRSTPVSPPFKNAERNSSKDFDKVIVEVKPLQSSARFDPVNCAPVKPRVY